MKNFHPAAGNALFYILIAIVLIGVLTAALRDSGGMKGHVDDEALGLRAGQMIAYATELESAVRSILQTGASENDLRFAHASANATYGSITATPKFQVFGSEGGRATYRKLPASLGDGSNTPNLDFGGERAFRQIGSDRADLYGNYWGISEKLCLAVNRRLGYTNATVPSTTCGTGIRFTGAFSASPSSIDTSALSSQPVTQFCLRCSDGGSYAYFFMLLPR